MVNSIYGSLSRALRLDEIDTAYLDNLRNRKLSFKNLESIQQLIDEAGDKDSNFYLELSDHRTPEEVIKILQDLYDEKSSDGFGAYYSLPYGDGQTIGDKTTGNPVKWVEKNIQELYDEILKGNPVAFLSGMAIVISRFYPYGRTKIFDNLKILFPKIQTDDERWQSVDKEQLEGVIEGNEITQGYNIVKRLNALHVEDKEYATINLGTWMRSSNYDEESFTNIMRIYGHMLNRTTSNFTGPLVDFFKGGNFEVKTSLLRRLLRARGPTALETLFSNYLIFRFSRGGKAGSAVGGGDLISRKNVTDWVKTGKPEKYPVLTRIGDETPEELLVRIRADVKEEGATKTQFEQWKNDIVPQVEDIPRRMARRMGRNRTKLEQNEYVLMLSVYHRLLKIKNEEGNFTNIPKTYNFALLDEDPENSFKMKVGQFKNAIALALTFNPISIEKIENVFNTLKDLEEEEPRDYFRIVAENAPALEAQIKSGVDELFTPIPTIIINELTEVLSTLNPNRIESLKNFIKIKNKNPYEYLHEIDALYDENLEQDPDYYKR